MARYGLVKDNEVVKIADFDTAPVSKVRDGKPMWRPIQTVTADYDPLVKTHTVNREIQNHKIVDTWIVSDLPAETVKINLKQYLANYRYSIETGGLNGIQTDRETRANLVSARTLAKEDANYTVKWKAANGAFVTLNAAQIIATADAVAAFVAKCFASEESVATAIDAGTHVTQAEVAAAFDTAMED